MGRPTVESRAKACAITAACLLQKRFVHISASCLCYAQAQRERCRQSSWRSKPSLRSPKLGTTSCRACLPLPASNRRDSTFAVRLKQSCRTDPRSYQVFNFQETVNFRDVTGVPLICLSPWPPFKFHIPIALTAIQLQPLVRLKLRFIPSHSDLSFRTRLTFGRLRHPPLTDGLANQLPAKVKASWRKG